MEYFKKFKGCGEKLPEPMPLKDILFAWTGSFIGIATIGYLTLITDSLLVMGSFGASSILIFAFPKSPFSQPRNVILGHFLSTLVGLCFFHFLGTEWLSMALSLATAIAIMLATRTVHPPAASNPIIVFLLASNWGYLFLPTLIGAIILVLVGLFYNNLHQQKSYPQYWF